MNRCEPGERLLAAVVHDVAPLHWSHCQALVETLEDLGVQPVSLLVVPRMHGGPRHAAFERWLLQRAEAGDELVLHGYEHRDPLAPQNLWQAWLRRVYTAGEGEFAALPYLQARQRLRAGRRWMASLGLRPQGFVAPAWLLSEGTWQALAEQPLRYTCTLREVVLLPRGPSLRSMAQVWSARSAWRRTASTCWNAALLRWQAERRLLRLELHPSDDRHAALGRAWREVLTAALSQRRQPVCLREVADLLETMG